MDELGANIRGGQSQIHFAATLYLLIGLSVAILATIPEVGGWGEALILLGLSALATLSVLPEISRFRAGRGANRLLLAFILLQVVSGILVGSHLSGKILGYRNEVWVPADLPVSGQLEEIFRMGIGVSDQENLLPLVIWVFAFHGVFISLITGLSYWTTIPTIQLIVLGLLWDEQQGVGLLGYAIVFVTVVSIGLEGVMRGSSRAERSGLPPPIFRQKAREILLLSLVVVVVAPAMPDLRTLTPIEKIWNLTSATSTGTPRGTLRFSTVYRFGANLRPDYSPALEVRSASPHYWRGLAFVNYTGREFLLDGTPSEPYASGEIIPTSYSTSSEPMELVQNFTLLSNFPGVVLNAFEPSVVLGAGTMQVTESQAILTEGSLSPGTKYTVVSRIITPDPDLLRSRTGFEGYEEFMQLPGSLPERVGDLARELTEGLDNSFDKAVVIAQYLKGMRYDISARQIPPDRDAIDYFLFEMQAGYCQHFAGAMALLCRSVGIPARVLTGFGSGTYSDDKKAYNVLQLNYHAWVEVGFPGFGWVAFDPTPGGIGGPEVADAAEASTILGGILPYYGSIRRSPTRTFVTEVPEYVSEGDAFFIEGTVLEGGAGTTGVPGVKIRVFMDVGGLDIPRGTVVPNDTVSVTVVSTRSRSEGSFSALCVLPDGVEAATGEAKLMVVCLGNDFYEGSSTNITVPVLRGAYLDLKVLGEDRSVVVASLRSSSGPIQDQPLRFFLDGNDLGTRVTNASGRATIVMEVEYGRHEVSVRFDGVGDLGPAFAILGFDVPEAAPPPESGPLPNWVYLALTGLIAASAFVLVLLRRGGGARRPESMTLLYHGMLEMLSSGGIRRRPNMTPFEFAEYAESRGAPGRIVHDLTLGFVREAYGGQAMAPEDLGPVRSALGEMARELSVSGIQGLRRSIGSVLSRLV